MDISLEAQLMINESFPTAVTGNTNELEIKLREKGRKAMPPHRGRTLMRKRLEAANKQFCYIQLVQVLCSLTETFRLAAAALQVITRTSQDSKAAVAQLTWSCSGWQLPLL